MKISVKTPNHNITKKSKEKGNQQGILINVYAALSLPQCTEILEAVLPV